MPPCSPQNDRPPPGGSFTSQALAGWQLHFAVTLLAQIWEPDLTRFIEHAFMIQTWTFSGTENTSYFNTWSISTEWFFYFAYAFLYPVIARLRGRGSMWLLAIAIVASFAIVWCV